MRSAFDRFRLFSILSLAALIFVFGAIAQTKKPQGDQKKNPSQAETEKTEQQDIPIRLDTDLVTVPVIASDRADVYVPDLTRDEFTVYEDGVKQEIEFFAAVRTPFSVVLMLDTSASTQEKLREFNARPRPSWNSCSPPTASRSFRSTMEYTT